MPPGDELRPGWLDAVNTNDLYAAKRKAAAVLGHRLRPGDLPSDAEVREQLLTLAREPGAITVNASPEPEPEPGAEPRSLAEALDRFAVYKCGSSRSKPSSRTPSSTPRATPSSTVSQVFHLARNVRPYDEEFLLAALLHDVGLAIDPDDPSPPLSNPFAAASPSARSG